MAAPQCCRCNGQGRYRRCSCSRSGVPCSNCVPGCNSRCENVAAVAVMSLSTQSQTLAGGLPPSPSRDLQCQAIPLDSEVSSSHESVLSPAIPGRKSPLPDPHEPVHTHTMQLSCTTNDSGANVHSPTHGAACANAPLPNFPTAAESSLTWGQQGADSFRHSLDAGYAEVVHWRKNSFKVPAGNAGKYFVQELSRLLKAFAEKSSLETVAFKAISALSILVLQKPFRTSKAKDHASCLTRRLVLWKDGNLNDLVLEGRAIQSHLPKDLPSMACQQLSRSFANLMFAGNTKAALRLITDQTKGDVLNLKDPVNLPNTPDKTVKEVLLGKHPLSRPAAKETLIQSEAPPHPHPIIFEALDASKVRTAALRTQGAAGPFG